MKKFMEKLLIQLGIIAKPELHVRWSKSQPKNMDIKREEIVIVVDNDNRQKWAVLSCPGNCGHVFKIPLFSNEDFHWKVSLNFFNRPSIDPSIYQIDACQAHFWVKNGNVVWCHDSHCGKTNA